MSSCIVCASAATVFCQQDNAFLCQQCDVKVHSANVVSGKHQRIPVCDLCHRSGASVYCKEDAAHLCTVCDAEVHGALPCPIKHTRQPVCAIGSSCGTAAPCPPAAATSSPPQQQHLEEDSNSACGKPVALTNVCNFKGESDCEVRSSEARVPQQPLGQQAEDTAANAVLLAKAPSMPKGFDFLDLDNSWLDRLDTGFDFADIFNTTSDVPNSDGLVPTLSEPNDSSSNQLLGGSNATAPHSEDDPIVPSFSLSLPDELPLPQLSAPKRPAPADAANVLMPPIKQQRMNYPMQSSPFQLKQEQSTPMMAPQWHPVPQPPAQAPMPVKQQAPQQKQPTVHHHQHYSSLPAIGSGAELTRVQRVERYREKKKNRKFEKTIRYASRKAYAEVRPRIKGRFATREEVIALKAQKQQQEMQQQMQLQPQMLDEDCVVPNFVSAGLPCIL